MIRPRRSGAKVRRCSAPLPEGPPCRPVPQPWSHPALLPGIYQCGPASVLAIKQGDVRTNYDSGFIYSEVNADICRWVCYSNGKRERVYCDTASIGRNISTKAVGSNHRVDITNNYKFPEGKLLLLLLLVFPGESLCWFPCLCPVGFLVRGSQGSLAGSSVSGSS